MCGFRTCSNQRYHKSIDFETRIRAVASNLLVKENAGKVAFTKGPITYCMEEADNGGDLWDISVLPGNPELLREEEGEISGVPVTFIIVPAARIRRESNDSLYMDYEEPDVEMINVRLVPYFAWANRWEGQMRVWIPVLR